MDIQQAEKIANRIEGYLQTVSVTTTPFVVDVITIMKNLGLTQDEVTLGLYILVMEGKIRISETGYVALEEQITKAKNNNREDAIEGMEAELQKAVDKEDYEKAAEYRDMIEEAKKNMEEI